MKNVLTLLLTTLSITVFAQKNPRMEAQSIVDEGKLLYHSEMASWYGTDVFLDNYKSRENIGGYISYMDNKLEKCIYFSMGDKPKVIGTITFDNSFDVKKAKMDLVERDLTKAESDLYEIRKIALKEIQSDTLFKTYNNTELNLIPLINGKERKVYILTGPKTNGVVIFGNDYLITFNNNNQLTQKKQLHKNIIPIEFGAAAQEGKQIIETIHSHLPETGDFMTATDICTLMLYEKFAKWKKHSVVSKKYLNTWNCETNQLEVVPVDAASKIVQAP